MARARKIFACKVIQIAVGYDADIALWDPNKTATLLQENLHHGADYTPYEGLEITGWPTATMLRGRFVVRDGALVGSKGDGRYFSRGKPFEASSASGNSDELSNIRAF